MRTKLYMKSGTLAKVRACVRIMKNKPLEILLYDKLNQFIDLFLAIVFFIFRGICSSNKDIQNRLEGYIWRLCNGYFDLYKQQRDSATLTNAQKDEFFGLRDFYRLEVYSEHHCTDICGNLCSSFSGNNIFTK